MDQNIIADKVRQQVRSLAFDERLEFPLESHIAGEKDAFTLPYRTDHGRDIMLYELHFIRESPGIYRFDRYDAVLLKPVGIPDVTIRGISTSALEGQLTKIDWSVPPGNRTAPQHAQIMTARRNLLSLKESSEGGRIADLLIVKYWPENEAIRGRNNRLVFNRSSNTFSVSRSFAFSEGITAGNAHELLNAEMNALLPAMIFPAYVLKATKVDMKKRSRILLESSNQYHSFAEAYTLLNQLDHRLFDAKEMQYQKLSWHLQEVAIVDTTDGQRLVSKSFEHESKSRIGEGRGIAIVMKINEQKISVQDFIRDTTGITAALGTPMKRLSEVRNIFVTRPKAKRTHAAKGKNAVGHPGIRGSRKGT